MEVRLDGAHLQPAADLRQQHRRFTVSAETPSTSAASACVIPWIRTRSKTSRSSSGSSPIARSMQRPSGLSPEALLGGDGTSPSFSSAAAG
jgi:hypothetical protein